MENNDYADKRADPIFAAIDCHRKLSSKCDRFYVALTKAESHAKEKLGLGERPFGLIKWRNYLIGGSELDGARERFLNEPGANKKQIEKEYRDAKKRYAAEMRAMREWDKRAGVLPKREELERLMTAERYAKEHLAKTKPTSPAGAGAIVKYVQRDIEDGEDFWHMPALKTVAAALARM